MNRITIINSIGREYLTSNIENGEYSYVEEAGSKEELEKLLGYKPKHWKLDIRIEDSDLAILIETKQRFEEVDVAQLQDYVNEERALHKKKKIVAILADTLGSRIRVWRLGLDSCLDSEHVLKEEVVINNIEYYHSMFVARNRNDREKVLKIHMI